MRATTTELSDTRAVVLLRPCWLARMLGARTVSIELVRSRRSSDVAGMDRVTDWVAASSTRTLAYLPHGDLIRDALDFHVVADLPVAVAKQLIGARSPLTVSEWPGQ